MLHAVSLALVLSVFWLLLSGYFFSSLLLSLGVVSVVTVVLVARRMDVIDHEGHPIHLTWRAILYWPWLLWEIVKANMDVAKAILAKKMPIDPVIMNVKCTQKTELGQVVYANSITLTPGTVTIAVIGDSFHVHALTPGAREGLETGEMDMRVTAVEGHAESGEAG